MGANDSILTFGFEAVESIEQSVGEIASEVGKDAGAAIKDATPANGPDYKAIAEQAYQEQQAEKAPELNPEHQREAEMER